jgi:hypothetical protein
MTVRINKQKINLREKLAETEEKVNFEEVVRGLGEYDGNVGIGTTSPSDKLEISNDNTNGVGDAAIAFTDQGGIRYTMGIKDGSQAFQISESSPLGQTPSDAIKGTRFLIDTNGNVGIGTTTPIYGLDVRSNLNLDTGQGLRIRTRFEGTGSNALLVKNEGGSEDTYFVVQNNGNVGIGTANPAQKLEVVEDRAAYPAKIKNTSINPFGLLVEYTNGTDTPSNNPFIVCTDQVTARMRVYSDGDVWTSDSGTLTSDERLKTNIVDATPKLEDIKKLKVRNFEWVPEFHPAKKGEKKIGFIAQELEEVFPGLVDEHDMTLGEQEIKRKSVRLGALIPILVKGIQEQQQIIDQLKSRIETLEQQ